MHWKFGGNLEPVQMICELDWKECPKAIANYIWSEIVTDVLDCLNNEAIIWRILALLLACIILLRTIYSRTKEIIETTVDKEMLNKVGYKMEDLELKVNILTYKLQYGSWPLPHQIQKPNFKKHLRNLRLTISSPNDRNNWIKHILLSPRRNESYSSYPKYNYSSVNRLTSLFNAKKTVYPYFRQDNLAMEQSNKSSKSSSNKSLKLNSLFERTINQLPRETSKSKHFEMQYRNTISLPLFPKSANSKSAFKLDKNSGRFKSKTTMDSACKKFTKTLDECKRYLKELHDSNKHLGLVCSSTEISDEYSAKDLSEVQGQRYDQRKEVNDLSGKKDEQNKAAVNSTEDKTDLEKTNTGGETSNHSLTLSNKFYPLLKLSDKCLMRPTMNITFCTDMFPGQSVSNTLISKAREHTKFVATSQEALCQVKKKLESLHNVLRTYEVQNVERKVSEKLEESNNRTENICPNVMKTLDIATTEADKWNEIKESKVNFDTDSSKNYDEMQRTEGNSSEQYESDATGESSTRCTESYCNTFNASRISYLNDSSRYSLQNRSESKIYPSITHELNPFGDNVIYSSSSKCEKVPERVYYAISSDSDEGKFINKRTTVTEDLKSLLDIYIDKGQTKLIGLSNQYPVPMETDEDLIMSPTSSHTEVSKDSESEDKPTAQLLQEALQFKQALLTRVELEKICYGDDQKAVGTNNESIAEYDRYPYINNNHQSKLLDIISEEQSVSSSTDKTSRTYMFFNVKEDKQLAHSSTFNNNVPNFTQQIEIKNSNTCKEYLDSKHNLSSPSEYFSFCNIIKKESGGNNDQLPLLIQNYFQQNVSTEVIPSNVQIKCFSNASGRSDRKLEGTNYANCINSMNTNMNEQKTYYEYMHEERNFEKRSLHQNNTNECINQSIHSVELFSENLEEAPINEDNENSSEDVTSNFLNSNQCTNLSYDDNVQSNTFNVKLKDDKIIEHTPNLSLKRHLGTCSLLDQILATTDIKKEVEMLKNENETYELSLTESKDTSTETNLIQDSLTSSINQSNDSNIPEPPSVTVLINKSLGEEKLSLNWLNSDAKYSDDYINETAITFSTNTITLKNCDTTDTNYAKKVRVNESEIVEVYPDKNSQLKGERRILRTENSFNNPEKNDLNNRAEYYKSYSTIISPHSSLYFTDEASSSTTKLNNNDSNNLRNDLHSNLYLQKNNEEFDNKDADVRDVMNIGTISISNKDKKRNIIDTANNAKLSTENEYGIKQKIPNPKNDMENTNVSQIDKRKPISTTKHENDKSVISYTDSSNTNLQSTKNINVGLNKIEPNLKINFEEDLNVDQYVVSHMPPHETSPRETTRNKAMKKTNIKIKSKSHESYTSKSDKLKNRDTSQNLKGLKSDLNNLQMTNESNKNSTYTKVRNLSAEPRYDTENNVKLDRKRSRSQIDFPINKPAKQNILQSYEYPSNVNTESVESKLKLKDHLKLLPTSKVSSKSCIPILKSRLEAARKLESEARPKSPMRGPLTMTMFLRDNVNNKNDNVMEEIQVEGKSETNNQGIEINSSVEKTGVGNNHIDKMKSSNIVQSTTENIGNNIPQQEQMVIYVNIFTKYDGNATKIVDPNKFLEYIKDRELKKQKIEKSEPSVKNETREVTVEDESSTMHKIVTIVSSVINGNELNPNMSTDLSTAKLQSESLANMFTNSKLKNLCFLSVEQREIDVTAKPSVIDTSTSISDLENISGVSKSVLSKFQICGTPRELNTEEYVTLLEILHQEPNFVHLQELQSICRKLVSKN